MATEKVSFFVAIFFVQIIVMGKKIIKLFLRVALSAAFFSAVADRFGIWDTKSSVWGNWQNFVNYTHHLNPWFPESFVQTLAIIATVAEIIFAFCLIVGFKTELFASLSGWLLLVFALSMTFALGIKGALDYSVYSASAGAFALSLMKDKFWEIDSVIFK